MKLLFPQPFYLIIFMATYWLNTAQHARANSVATGPADITVSGFSDIAAALNGVYVSTGSQVNNAPQWSLSLSAELTAYIQWSGQRWEFIGPSPLNVVAFSYAGTSAGPPCTNWLIASSLFGTPPALAGGCVSVTPPTSISSVTMDGFRGINADFNGTYTWCGTRNGATIWSKSVQLSATSTLDVQGLIQWSGTDWEVYGDRQWIDAFLEDPPLGASVISATLISGFAGTVATNVSCPQSKTVLPCGGWQSNTGFPLATSGCSGGILPATTIPTSSSSLTLVASLPAVLSTYFIKDLVLSRSGELNGAPTWNGQLTIVDAPPPLFSIPSLDVTLMWSNTTVSGKTVTWAIVSSGSVLTGSILLYNSGGSSDALPFENWAFLSETDTPTSFSLVLQPPGFISQPACQASFTVCEGATFQLPISVTNATAFQWYKGPNAISGQTSATLNLANLNTADAGVYSLSISGPYGSAVSNLFTLYVNPRPTNSSLTSGTLTCAQPIATLTATATGAVAYTLIKAGFSPQISANGQFTASQTGTYTLVAASNKGCIASTTATVTQDLSLRGFSIPSLTITCQGQTATLSASGCSGQVVWSTGATGNSINLTASTSSSALTATCTVGSCNTTAIGMVSVGQLLPSLAQVTNLRIDESRCPVQLLGEGIGTSFVFTGPDGYVFSNVFRSAGPHLIFAPITKPGTYTLTSVNSNTCGVSPPVTQTVAVNRVCP